MVDSQAEFESTDKVGTTDEFTGTVNNFGTTIPAVAGNEIDEISIRCRVDQPAATRLEFSFNGIDWFRLKVGESREEEPRKRDKSGNIIRQVQIRAAGSLTTAQYEIVMNRGQA